METWNLMKRLTLMLELCLLALSMKICLNCYSRSNCIFTVFAESCTHCWSSAAEFLEGCVLNKCVVFLQVALICYILWLAEMLGARRRKIVEYVWPISIWINWVILSMRICIGDVDRVERRGFCHDTGRLCPCLSQCHDEELSVHLALSIGKLEHFFHGWCTVVICPALPWP